MYKYSKYVYKGNKLIDYCKNNNINYKYVYSRLKRYNKLDDTKYLPLDIKIDLALNCYNLRNKYIYANIIYKNKKLLTYCKENKIQYNLIAKRIYYDIKNNYIEGLPNEERISFYIEKYYKLDKNKKLKNVIKNLLSQNNNIDYKLITKQLNINYSKMTKNIDLSNNINKLIILTWFCSDKEDKNGIYISSDKLIKLKTDNELDINDLIGLFKFGKKEYLFKIIEFEKYYIMGIIKKQLIKYNIIIPKYKYKTIIDDIELELIKVINNNIMRKPGQIVNYIYKSMNYRTLEYIIKNLFNKSYTYIDNYRLKTSINGYLEY